MNGYVHDELTRRWAVECGFSADDAAEIGSANVAVDRIYNGSVWRNKRYHFGLLGARRQARRWLEDAVARREPALLGQALHCEQDAVSHGLIGHIWHYPGIDIWERRSPCVRARIEGATKRMLQEYRERAV